MADYVIDGMGRKVDPVTKKQLPKNPQDDVPEAKPKDAAAMQKGATKGGSLKEAFGNIKKAWGGE